MSKRFKNNLPIFVFVFKLNGGLNHIICLFLFPSVIRQIPLSIESRLSTLSFKEKIFQEASPPYQKALQSSGYRHTPTYELPENNNNSTNINKIKWNRKRQIIWFNPSFNLNVGVSIAGTL